MCLCVLCGLRHFFVLTMMLLYCDVLCVLCCFCVVCCLHCGVNRMCAMMFLGCIVLFCKVVCCIVCMFLAVYCVWFVLCCWGLCFFCLDYVFFLKKNKCGVWYSIVCFFKNDCVFNAVCVFVLCFLYCDFVCCIVFFFNTICLIFCFCSVVVLHCVVL